MSDDIGRILSLAGLGFKTTVAEDESNTNKVCKDCGDKMGHPESDCENDAHDKNGDHWIDIDVDGDGDADIKVSADMAEAVGDSAEGFYRMQDEFAGGEAEGAHKVLIDELVRYLSGDQIEDFVSDFERHHDLVGDMDEGKEDKSPEDREKAMKRAFAKADEPERGETRKKVSLKKAPWEESVNEDAGKVGHVEMFFTDRDGGEVSHEVEVTLKDGKLSVTGQMPGPEDDLYYDDADIEEQLRDVMQDMSTVHWMGENTIDEADLDENAFNQAAAAAARAGKDTFEFGGKTHKTTMKKDTAHQLDDDVQMNETCGDCGCDPKNPNPGCDCPTHTHEDISEAPTMDTTQLITLLKNSGFTAEAIEEKLTEWANTPEGVGEIDPTDHGEAYEMAQSVNLSLKRYLDAQDMKVQVSESHTVQSLTAAYKAKK